METVVDKELPQFEARGRVLRVNFHGATFTSVADDGTERTMWRYTTAEFPKVANRDERIEAILATRYPTYGAELAAINNGGVEADKYHTFRTEAKQLATESFNAR